MVKKKTDKSVFDIGVEIADEIGDDDLKESLRQLRDHQSLQKARAEAVLQELTSGLPDRMPKMDGVDPFDALDSRINSVIQKNLDSASIWQFLLLCGNHMKTLVGVASAQVERTKIAKEEEARIFTERIEMLSTAGVKGAEAKHAGTNALKSWAVEKAKAMKSSDKKIAKELVGKLPDHLKKVSTEPERLIYDTLRASKKTLI